MLASVVINVIALSLVGMRARSATRFAFCFPYQFFKPEDVFLSGFELSGFGPLRLSLNFNDVDLKPYFIKLLLKFVVKKSMVTEEKGEDNVTETAIQDVKDKTDEAELEVAETDIAIEEVKEEQVADAVENIATSSELTEPKLEKLQKNALICIGEFPIKILVKSQLLSQKNDVQTVFIDKSTEEIIKWSKDVIDANSVSGLDANIETNLWFQVLPYLGQNGEFTERLKNTLVENKYGALLVASSWDGVGSAMLPTMITRFKEWNLDSVALALLPSRMQSPDAHFNALSSIGLSVSIGSAPLIVIGRDQLSKYVGVDRSGSVIKGNIFLNSLIEMMIKKKTFIRELNELSRSFAVNRYTILAATGASLKIYGSLENILDTTLFRPLSDFEMSTASLIYVLARIPLQLKERWGRDKIELEIAHWLKEKAILKSVYVTEPLYVEDLNDRVDVILFVGGIDLKEMIEASTKKMNTVKTQALKQGSIKEEEWKEIMKSLAIG